MKNLQVYIMMLIFFGIIGCTTDKENNVSVNEFSNKLDIENATIEEKIAYKTFHLKNITKLIEKYLINIKFKNLVLNFSTNEKKIYLSDIVGYLKESKIIMNLEDSNLLKKSENAFLNLENENWTPVFTILNYQQESYSKQSVTNTLYFFVGTETDLQQTNFAGYQNLDEDDDLEFSGNYNEEGMQDRFVILSDVAIIADNNETEPIPTSYGGGSNTTPTVFYEPNRILLHKMKIKNGKEDWISGDSEVSVVGFTTTTSPLFSGFCGGGNSMTGTNCFNVEGKRLDKIKRSNINNLKHYNIEFQNFLGAGQGETILNYVIFEEDSWPAPIQAKRFEFNNGQSRTIQYRSYQSPFHHAQVSRYNGTVFTLASTFSEDNSDIFYNFIGSL